MLKLFFCEFFNIFYLIESALVKGLLIRTFFQKKTTQYFVVSQV